MCQAAIAIGSNSTRLLVKHASNGQEFRAREETRLFSGLNGEQLLSEEKIEETALAVHKLKRTALEHGAKEISLLATSATRDARNADAFAARVLSLTGLHLQVISGQEEAALAFLAAAGKEERLVLDIGGGSTELSYGKDGQLLSAFSAQLGASRLLLQKEIASPDDAAYFLRLSENILSDEMKRAAFPSIFPPMIGLGGSCTTAIALQMGRTAHGAAVEGQVLPLCEAHRQLQLLSTLSMEARRQVPGLPPERAAHMPHGLCILIAAMTLCRQTRITVSAKTNLDGYLMQQTET